MRLDRRSLAALLAAAALLIFAACRGSRESSSRGGASRFAETGSSAYTIQTVTATAAVKSIDYANRTLTLQFPDGKAGTYKAVKDITDLDRVRAGDRVRAAVADALAVSMRKVGAPPNFGNAFSVSLAPIGSRQGMFVADTAEVTAKIEAMNPLHDTVTLKQPNGNLMIVKVAPSVSLAGLRKGDDVVTRYTEALALRLQRL